MVLGRDRVTMDARVDIFAVNKEILMSVERIWLRDSFDFKSIIIR
jgi:hypothetical protein